MTKPSIFFFTGEKSYWTFMKYAIPIYRAEIRDILGDSKPKIYKSQSRQNQVVRHKQKYFPDKIDTTNIKNYDLYTLQRRLQHTIFA